MIGSRRPQVASPSPFRILVAEDNPILRTAIRGLLRVMGHSVEDVANGREAVEAACARDFDFVLLDVQMPELDGIETAVMLRGLGAEGAGPRIVGMSGDPEARDLCSVAGIEEFLPKPIRQGDLVRVLRPATLA